MVTFGEESGMIAGSNSEFIIEAVVPDLGHFAPVVPAVAIAVLNGVGELENSLLGLGFFSDIGLLIVHSDHDVFVFGPSDDAGEGGSWGIIAQQSCLAHTRAVVNDNWDSLLFTGAHD